jgi:hypothetical protein
MAITIEADFSMEGRKAVIGSSPDWVESGCSEPDDALFLPTALYDHEFLPCRPVIGFVPAPGEKCG